VPPDRFRRIYRGVTLVWLASIALFLASGPFFGHVFNDRTMIGDIDRYHAWVSRMRGFMVSIISLSLATGLVSVVAMVGQRSIPWWWSVPVLLGSLLFGLFLWLAMNVPGGMVVT